MKLRFEPETLKFRLSAQEILTLQDSQSIEEEISLTQNKKIVYKVEKSEGSGDLSISLINNTIVSYIPTDTLNNWIAEDKVGVSQDFYFENNKKLTLVIEKDLPRKKKK